MYTNKSVYDYPIQAKGYKYIRYLRQVMKKIRDLDYSQDNFHRNSNEFHR